MLSCFRTVHDCDRWTHVLLRRALKLSSESAMALFCQALVETDQQHVARLLGYESLHTFVIVFIALSQGFFTCVCGDVWYHRERERERVGS